MITPNDGDFYGDVDGDLGDADCDGAADFVMVMVIGK